MPRALPALTCGILGPAVAVRESWMSLNRPGKAEFPRPAVFLEGMTAIASGLVVKSFC